MPEVLATKIRLAEIPPAYCSSCFLQVPESRHIDFGAAWDGPTFPAESNAGVMVAIDDLVVCERCLLEAALLVGAGDVTGERERVAELEVRVREMSERLAGQADYIAKLEQAAEARGRLEAFAPKPAAATSRRKAPSKVAA